MGRLVRVGLGGILALLLFLLGVWRALPWLMSPAALPAGAAIPSGTQAGAGSEWLSLVHDVRAGSAPGALEIAIPAMVLAQTLEQAAPGLLQGVRINPDGVTVWLTATMPESLPGWVGLSGRSVGAAVTLAMAVPRSGVLTVVARQTTLGRMGLPAPFPVALLLRAVARQVQLPAWVQVRDAALRLDLNRAGAIDVGHGLRLELHPTGVWTSPGVLHLNVTMREEAVVAAATLQQGLAALKGPCGQQGCDLQLTDGRALLTLPPLAGSQAARRYTLTVAVPRRGVLQLGVQGPGAEPAADLAALLIAALGHWPLWVSWSPHTLTLDLATAGPVPVGHGWGLEFTPLATRIGVSHLHVWLQALPVALPSAG